MLAADNGWIITMGTLHGTSPKSEAILGLATQVLLQQLCTHLLSHCIGTYPLGKKEEKHTHESLPISPRKHRSPLHEGLASSSHNGIHRVPYSLEVAITRGGGAGRTSCDATIICLSTLESSLTVTVPCFRIV